MAGLFAGIAGRYDLMNTLMTGGRHLNWKGKTARLAAQGLSGHALDVATGTGDLALALARCPGIDYAVGIDLLPRMVELARSKAAIKGLTEKTAITLGDAMRLPFPNGSFVCVTSGFSLRNMPDLTGALAEMARVVRPGGRVAILELTPLKGGAWPTLFRFYFHRIVPLMGRLVAGNGAAYTYLPRSVDYFPRAETLSGILRDLGTYRGGIQAAGVGRRILHWGNKPPS